MRRGHKRAEFVVVAATIVLLTGTMAASAQYDSVPPPPGGTFVDDDQIAEEGYIEAIAGARITLGCNPPANDRFCPDLSVTRAEMASFLVRALELPPSSNDRFSDDGGSPHEGDINAVAAAGITAVRFAHGPRVPYGFHSIPLWPDGRPLQTEDEIGEFLSGGCVRQPDAKAEALYHWAPIGTTVILVP